MNKRSNHIVIGLIAVTTLLMISCTPKMTANLYRKNPSTFNSIHARYKKLYAEQPFSVEFKDKAFNQISFEIIKDTIRYIYKFRLDERNLADTLDKYKFNTAEVVLLIDEMRSVHCTWINKMDYFINRKRHSIIYMSLREKALDSWLKAEQYYTIAFFEEKQYFDNKGRLVAKPGDKVPMRINYALYRKITDNICYAITENFR